MFRPSPCGRPAQLSICVSTWCSGPVIADGARREAAYVSRREEDQDLESCGFSIQTSVCEFCNSWLRCPHLGLPTYAAAPKAAGTRNSGCEKSGEGFRKQIEPSAIWLIGEAVRSCG